MVTWELVGGIEKAPCNLRLFSARSVEVMKMTGPRLWHILPPASLHVVLGSCCTDTVI